MWWAKRAGLPDGPATAFAFSPHTGQSGHYNRHSNMAMGLDTVVEGNYSLRLPGPTAVEFGASVIGAPCLPLARVLRRRAQREPRCAGRPGDLHREPRMEQPVCATPGCARCRAQWTHVAVGPMLRQGPLSAPGQRAGVHGIQPRAGVRHLNIALRTTDMCHCGCQGTCTLFPVMVWLRWSLEAMAHGRWPTARHDGSAFQGRGNTRAAMAGDPLVKAALVYILGDWAGTSHEWGFPGWTDVLNPRDLSAHTPPFPVKDHNSYEQACHHCEKTARIMGGVGLAMLVGAV